MIDSANNPVCPKCKTARFVEMKTPDHVSLDFCENCNGLWFDENELAEYLGLTRDLMEFDDVRSSAKATDLACPKCENALVEMPFSSGSDLLIDYCPGCRGTFFDFREAAQAQSLAAGQQSSRERLSIIKRRFFSKGFK